MLVTAQVMNQPRARLPRAPVEPICQGRGSCPTLGLGETSGSHVRYSNGLGSHPIALAAKPHGDVEASRCIRKSVGTGLKRRCTRIRSCRSACSLEMSDMVWPQKMLRSQRRTKPLPAMKLPEVETKSANRKIGRVYTVRPHPQRVWMIPRILACREVSAGPVKMSPINVKRGSAEKKREELYVRETRMETSPSRVGRQAGGG